MKIKKKVYLTIQNNIISKLPITNISSNLRLKKVKIPLKASDDEINQNVRARSARIRVAEKL